jgi:ATP-dependent Clp protease ATP-binding subunit ClpC
VERTRVSIETVVSVAELESGLALVRPIAGLGFAAYGEPEEAAVELSLFLGEHLRRAHAHVQAAFSIPNEVELRWIDVEIVRPDARERRGDTLNVAMPCAVVAQGRGRWAIVIPIGLTVYVEAGEDLDAIVSAEARRQIAASELEPRAILSLLPARAHTLERITTNLERRIVEGGGAALVLKVEEVQRRRHALGVLKSVARRALPPEAPEPVGLDATLATFDALMSGKERMSVLLVGQERVGKSALVHAWLKQRSDSMVYSTSGAQLIAGMSGLGQWQERVKRVMEAVETLDAVLWLDDMRDLFGDSRGHIDLPAAMKPWIDEGRVRVVGELTPEAADLFATRQSGLFSLLHPLRVEPGDAKSARLSLTRAIEHAKRHEPDRPALEVAAIDTIVELTDRFLPYRPFPAKAVRLYDELRASTERAHVADRRTIASTDVYDLFSVLTGIPLFLLRDDVAWRTETASMFFEQRIVGQRDAISRVLDTIAVVKAGLAPGDRPLASFLFVGPTGVGKTALARALAELLFGSTERLVRFDMSELSSAGAVERLIRGTESEEGLLTSRVRQQPFSVILLDEIEKAHPAVFDLLLPILGEGRLTDARGRTAYFHNAIVVMTSNLGTQHRARKVGIDPKEDDERGRYVAAVQAAFRPELVNRIDRIIPFHTLDRAQNRAVAARVVEKIAHRAGLEELGVALDVSEQAIDRLAEAGYAEAYGARALRRFLEDELVSPIARLLPPLGARARNARVFVRTIDQPPPPGHRLSGTERGGIVFDVVQGGERRTGEDRTALEEIADRRRWARSTLELPTIEEIGERVGYLLAELSYGKPDRMDSRERQSMQAEHHRLSEAQTAVEAAIGELESIEELALSASLVGESPVALVEDARLAEIELKKRLLALLLAPDPRHAITIMVEEWDSHRALDRWLGGLLRELGALDWQASAHVFRDPAPIGDWPKERTFGPPRTPSEILERLGRKERDPLTLLLTVRGPYAGVILALEAGLHRHHEPSPGVSESCFLVRALAQRATLTDLDFTNKALGRAPMPMPHEKRHVSAIRDVYADRIELDSRRGEIDVPRARYWPDIRAIALTHLLMLEQRHGERALLFKSPLDEKVAT